MFLWSGDEDKLVQQNEMLKMQLRMSHNHLEDILKTVNLKSQDARKSQDEVNASALRNGFVDNVDVCEVIHIALVCGGYNSTRGMVPLVKSILFYRRNPLHFHLLVDEVALNILKTLFNTWELPEVSVSFYPTSTAIPLVSWIPSAHYSGVFGLLKLALPQVLPQHLTKVIVLDTDLTFLADIAQLWGLFQTMKDGQVLGLVENQSDWYLGKLWHEFKPWPALGRGFNTGVILLQLTAARQKENNSNAEKKKHLKDENSFLVKNAKDDEVNLNKPDLYFKDLGREISLTDDQPLSNQDGPFRFVDDSELGGWWLQLWNRAAKEGIALYGGTRLADQDVFNAAIVLKPDVVKSLDCHWNIQLGDNTLSGGCYNKNYSVIKIIHWNSPRKYKVKLKNIKYFQSVHQMFLGYDGNLLRSKLVSCSEEHTTHKLVEADTCLSFRLSVSLAWRTHLYFMEFSRTHTAEDSWDVTLVAQLSMDRLQFLEELCKHWEGPMSLALYVSDSESQELINFIENWSETLKLRKNIAYHLVYKQGSHYPVNHLRNVALQNVVTPYVFLMDIDFLPMFGMYDYLKNSIKLMYPGPQKKAFVIPAFESQRYRSVFPRSKSAVLRQLREGLLYTFRARVWPQGHAATDYQRWTNTSTPYQIEWQPDYEPYIVAHKSIPLYDPRFTGFGWNKVSHILELHAAGYSLTVLPEPFIVHMPHAPSREINRFRNDPQYRMCLKKLKEEFILDLNQRYNTNFIADGSENSKMPSNAN